MQIKLPDALAELLARWRAEAETARRLWHESTARLLEEHADELERAWRAYMHEELSTREAARVSGYTQDYLADLARDEKIKATKDGTGWRFRRGDLPRKARPATGDVVEEMTETLLDARR